MQHLQNKERARETHIVVYTVKSATTSQLIPLTCRPKDSADVCPSSDPVGNICGLNQRQCEDWVLSLTGAGASGSHRSAKQKRSISTASSGDIAAAGLGWPGDDRISRRMMGLQPA